jgi:hypothetical protein
MKLTEAAVIEAEDVVYSDDVYSEKRLDEMVEDDTISCGECGFMVGYLEEESEE